MTTLTVTSKGQVTLRKEVLRHLGIKPGDKIDVDLMPGKMLSIRPNKQTGSIEDVFGMLASKDGPVLTLDEIKTATEEAWAGLHEDGKPYQR
ncbi:MAG: hypothetical protein JWP21_2450 [Tardiphaga sp.]|jgi:antitoxin PrlF|nr:hypothetical protein [Tardiphaga sp.]MDB5549003.1 hypothetical protein [Tardiphaga sp.]MDB5574691.1 hypothetical protein [Tardiphaga sp.]